MAFEGAGLAVHDLEAGLHRLVVGYALGVIAFDEADNLVGE